jgi:hypothetical protein
MNCTFCQKPCNTKDTHKNYFYCYNCGDHQIDLWWYSNTNLQFKIDVDKDFYIMQFDYDSNVFNIWNHKHQIIMLFNYFPANITPSNARQKLSTFLNMKAFL